MSDMEREKRYMPTSLLGEDDEADADPEHRDPVLVAALGYR